MEKMTQNPAQMGATLDEADIDAILRYGDIPCPVPRKVLFGLERVKDRLSWDHYYVVWSDEETGEEWEAVIVYYTPERGCEYHIRRC